MKVTALMTLLNDTKLAEIGCIQVPFLNDFHNDELLLRPCFLHFLCQTSICPYLGNGYLKYPRLHNDKRIS